MLLEYGERRFSVAAEDLVIGSDPGAAVRLAGSGVLPRHAVVRRLADGLVVIQAADPNAQVRVNGTPLGREPTPLLHGDRVVVAGHELRVADPRRSGDTRQMAPADTPSRPPAVAGSERAAAGRLVSLNDGREYEVDVAPFVFGRDATAAVVIASPDASRRHAEVVTRPDGDVLVDLSSNGTFVNGERVSGRHPLKSLDVIRIGAEEFRYYSAPKREAPAAAPAGAEYRLGDTLIGIPTPRPGPAAARPAPAPPPVPLAEFLVKVGERKGDRLHVRTPVANIGRAEYNDLQLLDPSISSSHAKLQLREGVWNLSDLGSTNGTFVDDVPVEEETALSPGCVVRLGEVRLLFEPRDERAQRVVGTTVLPKVAPTDPEPAPPRPAPAPPPRRPVVVVPRPPARRRWPWLLALALVLAAAALALVLLD